MQQQTNFVPTLFRESPSINGHRNSFGVLLKHHWPISLMPSSNRNLRAKIGKPSSISAFYGIYYVYDARMKHKDITLKHNIETGRVKFYAV